MAVTEPLRRATFRHASTELVPLKRGLSFLPIHEFSDAFLAFARDLSLSQAVAYIETNYHGGAGEQSAMVWENGNLAYGLSVSTDLGEPRRSDLPINSALRMLGVRRRWFCDEFDTVGLGHFRSNPD